MTRRERPATPPPDDTALLPARIAPELRRAAAADQVTIYLSEPAAPFVRGSYTLLAHDGIGADRASLMRGPLRPDSVQRFSVADREPNLLVEDVRAHPAFAQGRFAAAHGVVSLVRLSVRTTRIDRIDAAARMLTLWEVFLSYTTPRTREQLQKAALAARRYVRANSRAMRRHPPLTHLMNWRSHAARLRRLDAIAREANGGVDPMAPSTRRRNAAAQALDRIAEMVLNCCDLSVRRATVSFHHAYDWGDGDVSTRLLGRYPAPHATHDEFRAARARADAAAALVARDGMSRVVLTPTDAPGPPATSIAFPLFADDRLRWVLTVEADGTQCTPASLARLVRLVAPLELAIDAVTTTERVGAALAEVADVGRFNALPVSPRQEVVQLRLERLLRMVGGRAAAFVDVDGPEPEILVEPGDGPAGGRRIAVGAEFDALARRLQAEAHHRLLALPADGEAVAYHLDVDNAERPVRRQRLGDELRHEAERVVRAALPGLAGGGAAMAVVAAGSGSGSGSSAATSAIAESAAAADRGTLVLAPLWSPIGSERQVRGFLVVATPDHWPGFPRAVLRMDELVRAFASSLVSIERTAARNALQGWAAAGVGPIHQLLKVVEDCRHGVRAGDADAQRDALEVLGEQLWLLHQFSRPVARPAGRGASPTVRIAAAVASGVRHGVVLAGEIDEPTVTMAPAAAARCITATERTALNAVLSCLLSNAYTYGPDAVRIDVRLDGDDVLIAVANRAHMDADGELRLREAAAVAEKVAHGAGDRVFDRLAELAPQNGLRGVGTWLAARVARELLGGGLTLTSAPLGERPGVFTVCAVLRLPTHAPHHPLAAEGGA